MSNTFGDWVSLDVEIDVSRHQNALIHKDSDVHKAYLQWRESNSDEDWEYFTELLEEEIRDSIEFYIEEVD